MCLDGLMGFRYFLAKHYFYLLVSLSICFLQQQTIGANESLWLWIGDCVNDTGHNDGIKLINNSPTACFKYCGESGTRIGLQGENCSCNVGQVKHSIRFKSDCMVQCPGSDIAKCGNSTKGTWSVYERANINDIQDKNFPLNGTGCVTVRFPGNAEGVSYHLNNCTGNLGGSVCRHVKLGDLRCDEQTSNWLTACKDYIERLVSNFGDTEKRRHDDYCSPLHEYWIGLFALKMDVIELASSTIEASFSTAWSQITESPDMFIAVQQANESTLTDVISSSSDMTFDGSDYTLSTSSYPSMSSVIEISSSMEPSNSSLLSNLDSRLSQISSQSQSSVSMNPTNLIKTTAYTNTPITIPIPYTQVQNTLTKSVTTTSNGTIFIYPVSHSTYRETESETEVTDKHSILPTRVKTTTVDVRTTTSPPTTTETEYVPNTTSPPTTTETEYVRTTTSPPTTRKTEYVHTTTSSPTTRETEYVHTTISSPTTRETEYVHTTTSPPTTRETKYVHTTTSSPTTRETEYVNTTTSSPTTRETEYVHTTTSSPTTRETEYVRTTTSPPITRETEYVNTTTSSPTTRETEYVHTTTSSPTTRETEYVRTTTSSPITTETEYVNTTTSPPTIKETEYVHTITSSPTTRETEYVHTTTSSPTTRETEYVHTTTSSPTTRETEYVHTTTSSPITRETEYVHTTTSPPTTRETEYVHTTTSSPITTEKEDVHTTISSPTTTEKEDVHTTTSSPTTTKTEDVHTTTSLPTITEIKALKDTVIGVGVAAVLAVIAVCVLFIYMKRTIGNMKKEMMRVALPMEPRESYWRRRSHFARRDDAAECVSSTRHGNGRPPDIMFSGSRRANLRSNYNMSSLEHGTRVHALDNDYALY